MKRSAFMYALLVLVLLGIGGYLGMPYYDNAGADRRFASYQLALSLCAVLCFFLNFAASIRYLIRHRPGADAMALATAEVGLLICCVLLTAEAVSSHRLVSVWWTWSTRGTAVLLLGLVYASYLILRRYANVGQTSTLAAVLAIFAFADIPLTYVSVAMRNAARHVAVAEPALSIDAYRQLVETSIVFGLLAVLAIAVRYRNERRRQQANDREAFAASWDGTVEQEQPPSAC